MTRSAAGRLAAEGLALLPTSFASAAWTGGSDDASAIAVVEVGGRPYRVTLHVSSDGRLEHLTLPRWGNAGGGPYREQEFSVSFDEQRRFGGLTIPCRMQAGWSVGDQQPFFRAWITDLRPLSGRSDR